MDIFLAPSDYLIEAVQLLLEISAIVVRNLGLRFIHHEDREKTLSKTHYRNLLPLLERDRIP